MKDLHDVVEFSYNKEKILGIVIKHYTDPLNDFYVIYADHTLFEWRNDDDCSIISDNVIMLACDAAIVDYKLKKQNIQDIIQFNNILNSLMEIRNMNIDTLFNDINDNNGES